MNQQYSTESAPSILIVDDTPHNLRLLSEILHDQGYSVRLLREGRLVMTSVLYSPPDLILLDIMMPDMNGYEVCEQLKADERTRQIPVIFLSALTDVAAKVKAFAAGGVDYIAKPFKKEETLLRIYTQVTLQQAKQQLQQQNANLQQEISVRKQTEHELQRRNRELSLVNHIGQLFSSSLDLDQVLVTALQEVQRLLNVVSTSIWLLIPETGEIECSQIIGPGSEQLHYLRLPAAQGITGWAATHGETIISPDVWDDPRHYVTGGTREESPVRSMVSIPLKVKGNVIGVLNLVDPQVDRFTEEDVRFVEPIASAAAIAIENARLYTEVKDKNVQLQELNASKDKFFSIISHDLRSPFNTLLGFAQLLVEKVEHATREQLYSHASRMLSSAERLYALLENLLTWSRLQRGMMEYHPSPLDMSDIAEDNVLLFRPKAEEKGVTLINSISEGTSAYGDFSMVKTVVRNLLSNALKFTRGGDSITLTASHQDAWLFISVADTGIGISKENVEKLFRLDVHHSSPGTAGERGTGLGLLLCQELVQKNGGKIWVESEIGQGTTFRFLLPLHP